MTAEFLAQHAARGARFSGTNYPDLVVSKQKLRQAERIELFGRTATWPARPVASEGTVAVGTPERLGSANDRTSRFSVWPFGQNRLVPIFRPTLAVQQKGLTIRFRTAAGMLETFGMQTGGKYRRLVEAFERVFGATIFFGTDSLNG